MTSAWLISTFLPNDKALYAASFVICHIVQISNMYTTDDLAENNFPCPLSVAHTSYLLLLPPHRLLPIVESYLTQKKKF